MSAVCIVRACYAICARVLLRHDKLIVVRSSGRAINSLVGQGYESGQSQSVRFFFKPKKKKNGKIIITNKAGKWSMRKLKDIEKVKWILGIKKKNYFLFNFQSSNFNSNQWSRRSWVIGESAGLFCVFCVCVCVFVCCVFCLSLGKGSLNFFAGVCYLFNWLVAGTAKEKHTQKSKKKKICQYSNI